MRWVLSVLVTVGLVTTACSEAGDIEVATDQAGFAVRLLEEGEGETVVLRVAAEPGATQSVITDVTQSQTIRIAGQEQTIDTVQSMSLSYVVREVDGDVIVVDGTYEDATFGTGVDVPGSDELARQLTDAFVGQTVVTRMTNRGAIVSGELPDLDLDLPGVPPGFLDQMFDSIEDNLRAMSVPTPVEAVGIGASWSASAELEMAGMPMTIETVITITDITADTVIGDMEQTITFVAGEIEMFGAQATIEGGELRATGTITYSRDGFIVPLVEQVADGTVTMSVQGQTIDQAMSMTMRTTAR